MTEFFNLAAKALWALGCSLKSNFKAIADEMKLAIYVNLNGLKIGLVKS